MGMIPEKLKMWLFVIGTTFTPMGVFLGAAKDSLSFREWMAFLVSGVAVFCLSLLGYKPSAPPTGLK